MKTWESGADWRKSAAVTHGTLLWGSTSRVEAGCGTGRDPNRSSSLTTSTTQTILGERGSLSSGVLPEHASIHPCSKSKLAPL